MTIFAGGIAYAQQSYWVQVEAKATLREGEETARQYAQQLADVNGFRLGASGWYAVVIGPYTEAAAAARLQELRAQGAIPGDAYISDSTVYSRQFWPVGGSALGQTPAAQPAAEEAQAAPVEEPVEEPEETRAEALQSERTLDGDQRKALQVALKWEGFYTSLIDGDFGPGTRGAMAAWQEDRGYDPTGVLTTRQRAALLGDYQAALDSIGLAPVTDADAGISIEIPAALVRFSRYEAPFAHYEGDKGVRVVLISQSGDKATLYGLYDILQTLDVVPPVGERSRRDADFTIEGADSRISSYTQAKLVDGAVKGFMLIWPTGDDKRRAMVLDAMRDSFASTGETVLGDNAGLDTATQSIDLISGLEIRRAEKARSGFFVSADGAVLTTTEAVAGCARITLNDSYEATVAAVNAGLGLALLTPAQALAPISVAAFLSSEPRLQSELAVAGYSYGGRLSAPTLTFGTLADLRGLDGEETIVRLALTAQDGDSGGPVLDQGGAVVGMLLAPAASGRQLPADAAFAAKAGALTAFLDENGVTATATGIQGALTPYDLSTLATNMTVLVSCWN